jgi:hypothetical protein
MKNSFNNFINNPPGKITKGERFLLASSRACSREIDLPVLKILFERRVGE